MPWLVAVEGPFGGAVRLEAPVLDVGRSADAELTLGDPAVSRRHCRLRRDEEGWWVEDLGSRGGTVVNGRPVTSARLDHGDLLRVGNCTLRFVAREGVADEPPVAVPTQTRIGAGPGHAWRAQQLDGLLALGENVVRARTPRTVVEHLGRWLRDELHAMRVEAHRVHPSGVVRVLEQGDAVDVDPVEDLLERALTRAEVLFEEQRRVLVIPLSGDAHGFVCAAFFAVEDPEPQPWELRLAACAARLAEGAMATATALLAANQVDEPSDGVVRGGRLLTRSAAMRPLLRGIERAAPSDVTVLVRGESGTGKELVARGLHARSTRALGPFVEVNCGALSESLLEAELFGHEKGAFTGATATRPGRFERADGGTLFLDEVGELSPAAQTRLLRVLETRRIERVGGSAPFPVDVRVIAATHRDLRRMCEEGAFREDLYFRLAVVELEVPPLRDRPEDVELLARAFYQEAGGTASIDDAVIALLLEHRWPGNVRQLRNAMEHAAVMADGPSLTVEDLPASVRGAPAPRPAAGGASVALPASMQEVEEAAVRAALDATRGNKTAAARLLGINRATLYAKLELYGIA